MARQVSPLWSIGFRPFFLLAGLVSVVFMILWAALLKHGVFPQNYYSPVNWHSHEMLFGYTVAVIGGFLLTAVRNWTGQDTAEGYALIGLSLLWLLGRIAPFTAGILPDWSIAIIDLAFLPCLIGYLLVPILQQRKFKNLAVIVLLLCIFAANIVFHSNTLGISSVSNGQLTHFVVGSTLVFISMIGGRVVPFFIRKGLPGANPVVWPLIEKISVLSLVVLMILKPFFYDSIAFLVCSIFAIVANTIRVTGWYCKGVFSVPLLWVLFAGYSWMIVGLSLDMLATFNVVSSQLALHAMTAGCIGVLTLGMMSRVSLGHTGRVIKANNIVAIAFILINIAVIFRVILPLFLTSEYLLLLNISSVLWVVSFVIFMVYFTPILFTKRADE